MKKLSLLLGAAVILMMGFAITISNASATDTGFQTAVEPELKSGSSDTQLSAPELAFQELNSKALASIGEGWIYVMEIHKHDVDPLPDIEGLIPLVDTTSESWFYINSAGRAERSVTVVRTMDGQIDQVGIYSNGTGWNTKVDEIMPREPFLFEGWHYGLPYLHLKSPDIKLNNIIKGGIELTEFTITVAEKEPVDMLDYDKALVSMEHYYAFDTSTGFLVIKKTIAHLEDGTQREADYIQVDVKIGVEPPIDVLKYFDVKKEREEQK